MKCIQDQTSSKMFNNQYYVSLVLAAMFVTLLKSQNLLIFYSLNGFATCDGHNAGFTSAGLDGGGGGGTSVYVKHTPSRRYIVLTSREDLYVLLYGWTIVILYLYIINGRLEADVNKSVESHCVLLKSSHHNWC